MGFAEPESMDRNRILTYIFVLMQRNSKTNPAVNNVIDFKIFVSLKHCAFWLNKLGNRPAHPFMASKIGQVLSWLEIGAYQVEPKQDHHSPHPSIPWLPKSTKSWVDSKSALTKLTEKTPPLATPSLKTELKPAKFYQEKAKTNISPLFSSCKRWCWMLLG